MLDTLRDTLQQLVDAKTSQNTEMIAEAVDSAITILEHCLAQDQMAVIVAGNPIDGIGIYGPVDIDEAGDTPSEQFERDLHPDWWLKPITPYIIDANTRDERLA